MPGHKVLMLRDLKSVLDQNFDVFICSASYEDRCKSIPDAVAELRNVHKKLVCFNQK